MNLQRKSKVMRIGIVLALLFSSVLISVTVNEVYAKCIDMDNCTRPLGTSPLKEQLQEQTVVYEIKCMKIEHWLTERPNGKLACIKHGTAEKLGWNERHFSLADSNEELMVTSGVARVVPYKIHGAALEDLSYEDRIVTATITPQAQYSVLSLMIKDEMITINPEQCDTLHNNTPSISYVASVNGEQRKVAASVNYSGEFIVNIHVTQNVETIQVIGLCKD